MQDVHAQPLHAELGYKLNLARPVRLSLLADYASGDNDSTDGKYTQFNTLSGARRFDFGPTDIYGAFARSNIISPGLQASFQPATSHSARLVYRAIWFDAASNTSNTTKNATAFIGHQVEARWRYD